ncbi:sodium P-type ATPase-like protein [Lentithecium fluviatile CBS 122367]|uniref:P-type Na(+) transporter n=1 Tax=Lentithecium fluviatile CBS 122367 TaxID=1168545 RepID=A0A6G1IFZ1_9PLEO|nr:sodium P-type ATPase-like protein [Lentithecium fluviatile CBS 122367]
MGKKEQPTLEGHVSGQSNSPLSRPAHALPHTKVVEEVGCDTEDGLSTAKAKELHQKWGNNDLGEGGGVQPGRILLRQVANAMTLILIIAMAVSFAIKSWIEGGVVTAIIILNVVVGFMQEFNAEKTMDSLRSLSSPTATAVRNGKTVTVPTIEVVPGDMVELKTGDTVPADVRLVLIEAVNFETDEALLTGESLPVTKDADALFDDDTGPGDRLNVAFSSSTVTKGRARGVVFATGLYTEIGSIAASLRDSGSRRRPVKRKEDGTAGPHRHVQAWGMTFADAVGHFLGVNVGTPLQRKLSKLAVLLFGIAVVCAIIVMAANSFANDQEVIIYAVATGLSMIPASLIVVLTITMAAGTKRMVERNVIVRNLKSLEALGGVTDICSDKTGTLTQGKMVAKRAWIPAKGTYSVGVTDSPFNPTLGSLAFTAKPPSQIDFDQEEKTSTYEELLEKNKHLLEYVKVASLANLAHVHQSHGEEGVWNARGDPTEIAIQVFASRFNWNRLDYTQGDSPQWKQLAEFPFDSDVKKMSVIFEEVATSNKFVFTKGAVERVIYSCTSIFMDEDDEPTEMTDTIRDDILKNMESLAALGLRVLALASKSWDGTVVKGEDISRDGVEVGLAFRGLVGLYDPPRPETAGSVRQCQKAGISVHMLTGDHPGTARAIAGEVGILPSNMATLSKDVSDAMVMTASQFDKLSDDEIDGLPLLPLVIARCAPQTKVRMIDALHRRKAFAAMTGDGVNDSPSLKRSDVGIGMGTGSDVAKDASDIVLTDDNFASILNAIEEGRRMFDNIQKFILHLLAQNIAQACTLLIGLVFKDETGLSVFPLSPVEVMWIIMVTSSVPDMGLGFEVAAPDILSRPPQSLKRGVFTLEVMCDMVVYGLWIAALCLASFTLVLNGFGDGNLGSNCNDSYTPDCDTVFRARATCFACLTWFSLFLAWQMVDMRRSFFMMQPNSKKYLTQWFHDVWRNKFLFWSIIAGFITIFPVMYIPVINRTVFKHTSISWEWAIVFVATFLFFLGVEAWKWGKRFYFRKADKKMGVRRGSVDLEKRVFERYLSTAVSTDDEKV